MKYNLIFSGIQQTDHENENTEAVLKYFIHTELDVGNVGDIEFHNVVDIIKLNVPSILIFA
jgi:hypothetical protein